MTTGNPQAATLDDLRPQATGLRAVVAQVEAQLPGLVEAKAFRSAAEELARAEELLHPQRRSVIGLFGAPQVGKTSALAAVFTDAVGPPLPEPVFRIGAGQQTDRVLMRIRRAREGQTPALEYCYLTPPEYHERRQAALQRVALDPSLGDEVLLARIEQLLASVSDKPEAAVLDLRDAADLLRCYQQHGAKLVREPRLILTAADRDAGPDAPAPVERLLGEIRAHLVLDRMPANVDYVELPFVPQSIITETPPLDGLVVFLRADCLETEEVSAVGDVLHATPLPSSGIVLVITKMDLVRGGQEAPAEQGFEAHLLALLARWGVPIPRVCLVALPWSRGGRQGMPDWEVRLRLHQPDLATAFAQTVRDGGVGRLQAVLFEHLPQQISEDLQSQAAVRLRSARDHLVRLLELARQQQPRLDWYDRAVRWRNLVAGLDDEVLSPALLESLDSDLGEILAQRFDLLCPAKVVVEGQDLRRAHERAAVQLSEATFFAIGSRIWPAVAEQVAQKLAAGESDPRLGTLPLSGSVTAVSEGWAAAAAERPGHDLFQATAERFLAPPLFPADAPPFLSGQAYRQLMREKISLVAQQAVLAVAREARGRLQRLRSQLEDLLDGAGQVPQDQAQVVDELLGALR